MYPVTLFSMESLLKSTLCSDSVTCPTRPGEYASHVPYICTRVERSKFQAYFVFYKPHHVTDIFLHRNANMLIFCWVVRYSVWYGTISTSSGFSDCSWDLYFRKSICVTLRSGLKNRDYGRRGSAALTTQHLYIRKIWHKFWRQNAVPRSI
jgi:hypothetical protein